MAMINTAFAALCFHVFKICIESSTAFEMRILFGVVLGFDSIAEITRTTCVWVHDLNIHIHLITHIRHSAMVFIRAQSG
jgi:hypothetical protein